MTRPRTFVSSTAYDLKDARATLKAALKEMGHDPIMHEDEDFGVAPGVHSHEACIDQVEVSDFFVLVIGGRFGGTYVGSERSITNEEYRAAKKRGCPILVFVKRDVDALVPTYRKNPGANFKPTVDDVRIFDFIDRVRSESVDNWTWTFETVTDIVKQLQGQFSHFQYLFAKEHRERLKPSASKAKKNGPRGVLAFPGALEKLPKGLDDDELTSLKDGLKNLHRIVRMIRESGARGYAEKMKVLWIFGRHGQFDTFHDQIEMDEPNFKQFAWGTHRGSRVFDQLKHFDVRGEYESDYEDQPPTKVTLRFGKKNAETLYALREYVKALVKADEEEGPEALARMDLSVFR